ncbi:hypothetical protein [Halobacillus litoralis]|nr:hypothetical protein [Halobacillus litoralis]MCA1021595.1 hypothetical protein [Halobacillus litoralis]
MNEKDQQLLLEVLNKMAENIQKIHDEVLDKEDVIDMNEKLEELEKFIG